MNPFGKYNMLNRHVYFSKIVSQYDDGDKQKVVKIQNGLDVTLFVSNMEDVKQILITDAKLFRKRDTLAPMSAPFGPNMLTSDDNELWKRHRLLAGTALTNDKFLRSELIQIVDEEMDKMFKSTEAWRTGTNANLTAAVNALTMDVIGKAGFDYEFNQFESVEQAKSTTKVINDVFMDMMLRFFLPDFLWKLPFGLSTRSKNASDRFRSELKPIIDKMEKKMAAGELDSHCVLSLMMEKKKELGTAFTDEELISNCFLLLLAGQDTTSSALQYAYLYMNMYPEWQPKLQQEVDEICGKEKPTYDHLKRMELLEAFIKETLRIRPPVIGSTKISPNKEWILRGTGTKLPPNSLMMVSINDRNRKGPQFVDPDTFDPERFLNRKTITCESIPFMAGRRDCAGKHFAMVEASYFIARMLQLYTVQMKQSDINACLEEKVLATVSPTKDVIVQLIPRE
jgi:cytochrome P450